MSVLGETHVGSFMDLRAGLLGRGIGLGQPPLVPLPLWPPPPPPSALWCNSTDCLCHLSRSHTLSSSMLDYMLPHTWETPSSWPAWYLKHTAEIYKRSSVDTRESPSKELPTKLLKHERIRDRQELPQTLNFSREHVSKFVHKSRCTGTQTQYAHVERDLPPPYMNGDMRQPSALDNYSMRHSMLSSQSIMDRGSPPHYVMPMDTHDTPLNLSLTSTTLPSSTSAFTPQVSRPSVITCAPTTEKCHRYGNNNSPLGHSLPSPSRREVLSAGVFDPAIEEHFRRSLGKNYSDFMSPKLSPKTPPVADTPPPVQAATATGVSNTPTNGTATGAKPNVSITGSVDDHFAKSLGNSTWSAIKAKNDPMQEVLPGSVDDHFAKALGGETWLKIKAEKESSPSPASFCHTNGSPPPPSPHSKSSPHRHDSLLST